MEFFAWLEQSAIGTWVNQSESVLAYPTVLLFHTLGLTLLVGLNLMIGLRILGFAQQIPMAELEKVFPLIWIGFALSAVSGILLLTAKATQFFFNPAFYVKMIAIAVAVVVFFAMRATLFRDPQLDKQPPQPNARLLGAASIALWLVALTAGRVMAYVGEAAEFAALIMR
jgi:hypothetical protein